MLWFSKRLRDLIFIPENLVREFVWRMGRVLKTLWRGILGIVLFLPRLANGKGLLYLGKRSIYWLLTLRTNLFDLIAGPEICQFFLHLVIPETPLTDEELALAKRIFGEKGMRWQSVRVAEGGLLTQIAKKNGRRSFATWHTINLINREDLPVLMHELTHIYQFEHQGSMYLSRALNLYRQYGLACYDYGGEAGVRTACANNGRLSDFNLEQQAMIVQHYCARLLRNSDTSAYEPMIEQLQAGLL